MRASLLVSGFVALSIITIVACTAEDPGVGTPSTPEEEAGTTTDSGGKTSDSSSGQPVDSGGPSGNCTALTQEGTTVDIISTKAAQPTPTGGTPVDGKFILTGVRAFAAILAEGSVVREFGAYTIVLGGSGKTFEQIVTNEKKETTRAKGDLVVSNGNEFKATPSCEEPLPDAGFTIIAGQFSIDATTLKMYVVRDFGITAELTFTKK
jgi:hypothetical protein